MNQVFRVASDQGILFLKIADEQDLRREVAVLRLLPSSCVPVPEAVAQDLSGEFTGAPCILLRHVGGHPLGGGEPELAQVGTLLRRVHDIALPGFGALSETGGRLTGEDTTWPETMRRRGGGLGPAIEAGLVPGTLVERALAAVSRHEHQFGQVSTGHLLHGDFHPRHVYAAGGAITGIIDWGDATVGDPLYDFGRLLYVGFVAGDPAGGRGLLESVVQTYDPEPDRLRESPELLLVYAVVFGLWSMAGEFEGGAPWPPWWPARGAALASVLDELERHDRRGRRHGV
jgi:aminoglycoside phosphotransferase (APT) family kinase protein